MEKGIGYTPPSSELLIEIPNINSASDCLIYCRFSGDCVSATWNTPEHRHSPKACRLHKKYGTESERLQNLNQVTVHKFCGEFKCENHKTNAVGNLPIFQFLTFRSWLLCSWQGRIWRQLPLKPRVREGQPRPVPVRTRVGFDRSFGKGCQRLHHGRRLQDRRRRFAVDGKSGKTADTQILRWATLQ